MANESDDDVPDQGDGRGGFSFPELFAGQNVCPAFTAPPILKELKTKELRFRAGLAVDAVRDGDWLQLSHHKVDRGLLVGKLDEVMLLQLGSCVSVDGLIEIFSSWHRLGPSSALVSSLKMCRADAQLGASVSYVRKIGDYDLCRSSLEQDGSVRGVEFSDDVVVAGQLTLLGLPGQGLSIYGFLERSDPSVALALELPSGEIIENFDEDGPVLNLRRMPLATPIALLDVRVRRL